MPTAMITDLLTEATWPYDPVTERALLLERFCKRDTLQTLGETLELEWFDDTDIGYHNEWEAATTLADVLETPAELENAVANVPINGRRAKAGFHGWHYVAEVVTSADTTEITVTEGPAWEEWTKIADDVQAQADGNDTLVSFLRGMTDQDASSVQSDQRRIEFSTAQTYGSRYTDDGQLYASHVATEPSTIHGIQTLKTQSGRSYSLLQERIPVIAAVAEALATADTGPITTPEQEVPDEFDRRIPKFEEVLDTVDVTESDIEAFEEILAEHEATEYWADYIAPTVQHRPRAKRALLCMLASPNDSHGTKGRTNAIIYGPPGTGKTAFKNFLVEEFGAYSIDGARVSQADLTYNKRTDEDGLLVRAHRGLAVIEEADELDDDALGAALTALGESGQIEIREMRLPAEVRGVLLGNYQSRADIIAAHSEALFNRFEFVLHFDRLDADQRDTAIDWQYDHFREPKDPADTEFLKTYIAWVRAFDPGIPDTELKRIKEYKRDRIDNLENVREGISILTVAYTIARLNHRNLRLHDYKQAYDLVARQDVPE